MSENRLRSLERFSRLAEQRGVRVAKAVPAHGREAELLAGWLKHAPQQVLCVYGSLLAALKQQRFGFRVLLDYKPLKGDVTGKKRGARFLVESLTGLGTVATYLVGNNSSSFNAPFSSSALLRERLAGNVAIAGQNELNELTLNQNVVVTLPGSTRFYLVLQKGTAQGASPTADRRGSARSPAPDNSVPSLQELRQLLELRRELSQMYEQAGAPTGNAPQP